MDDKTSTETRGPTAAAERNRPTLKTIAFMTGLGVTTVSGKFTKFRLVLPAPQAAARQVAG